MSGRKDKSRGWQARAARRARQAVRAEDAPALLTAAALLVAVKSMNSGVPSEATFRDSTQFNEEDLEASQLKEAERKHSAAAGERQSVLAAGAATDK